MWKTEKAKEGEVNRENPSDKEEIEILLGCKFACKTPIHKMYMTLTEKSVVSPLIDTQ